MSNVTYTPRGRPFRYPLRQQLDLTVFKIRYHLPYRVLEVLTGIDHVTLSRMVRRCITLLSKLPLIGEGLDCQDGLVVDTTTVRLGKSATKRDYTGYKHMKGVKFQCVVTPTRKIAHVSAAHPASTHDKVIFEREYINLRKVVNPRSILGDKAYVGLTKYGVIAPAKRCETKYKNDPEMAKTLNRALSKKRVIVEHVFASLKRFQILRYANYFSREWVSRIFYVICVLHNMEVPLHL